MSSGQAHQSWDVDLKVPMIPQQTFNQSSHCYHFYSRDTINS